MANSDKRPVSGKVSISTMFDSLKRDFKTLRSGTPGRRFRDFRRNKKQQRAGKTPVARIATFVVGFALVVGGIVIGWVPGPGGFIALIGLAILSREIPGIATVLDMGELLLRGIFRWFRRQPLWLQSILVTVAFFTVATSTWYGYRLLG